MSRATIALVDSVTQRKCIIIWRNIVTVEYASGSNQSIDKAVLTLVNGKAKTVNESVMDVAILIEQAARDEGAWVYRK